MKYLPKAALGAWAWGNDGTFGNHYTASDLKEVYEAAMDNGLNLWDTAVVYGMGVSENILGELTKNTERKKLILSTKFTPQIEDGTPMAMQNMLNGSKERLHTDVIDIYWIHNPMDVEKYTHMLIPLAKSGQIKEIGVSNHNLAELKQSVHEYEITCGEEATAAHYLAHVALFTNSDAEDTSDKVKLMTIHAAKGLEFPYVLLCGMNEGVFPSRKTKDLLGMEEERRLAFVAITRAEKGLFLSGAEGRNFDGSPRNRAILLSKMRESISHTAISICREIWKNHCFRLESVFATNTLEKGAFLILIQARVHILSSSIPRQHQGRYHFV